MLRPRKPARGPGKLRLPLRGILLGSLVLLSLASSLWTLRRALGADRAPDLMNGARMLRSLAPNTCAHGACHCDSCGSSHLCSVASLEQCMVCQAPRAGSACCDSLCSSVLIAVRISACMVLSNSVPLLLGTCCQHVRHL